MYIDLITELIREYNSDISKAKSEGKNTRLTLYNFKRIGIINYVNAVNEAVKGITDSNILDAVTTMNNAFNNPNDITSDYDNSRSYFEDELDEISPAEVPVDIFMNSDHWNLNRFEEDREIFLERLEQDDPELLNRIYTILNSN